MQHWIFSIITPVFSVTRFFRNHNNMLIYYQCAASYCFLEPVILFSLMFWWIKFLKGQHLSIYTFYPFNTCLLNKSINFFKRFTDPNFWIVVYTVTQFFSFFSKLSTFLRIIKKLSQVAKNIKKHNGFQHWLWISILEWFLKIMWHWILEYWIWLNYI